MGFSDVVKSLLNLELYIYVVLAVGSFLVVFAPWRRRSNNAFLRFLIMVVFNSSFTLITMIIGQMVSIPTAYSFLFPIWAAYLVLFNGLSDSISAHSLEDNEQWKRSLLNVCVAILWVGGVAGTSSMSLDITIRVFISALAGGSYTIKADDRILALQNGSKNGVAIASKLVADFMDLPAGSAYHNYVVVKGNSVIDTASDKVITVGKVWTCEGKILSEAEDPDSKIKDLCLSFSMYNLLCCHFAGYSFPQSTRDGQWEFLRDALLHGDVEAGENYLRPFRLIEQELGFLYDRFYTKYAILFASMKHKIIFFVYAAVIGILIQRFILIPSKNKSLRVNSSIPGVDSYILVTRIIIGVFMCLEFLQILLFTVSNWGKLLCICKYVGKPTWRSSVLYEQFVQVLCSFPSFKLWGRELGQYCFLESFDRSPPWWIYNTLSRVFLEDPGKGHAENTFVPLSSDVQKAVLGWIKQNGWRITKGRASLVDNGVRNQELLSSCDFEETTKVIMIWHIATSLCEFRLGKINSKLGVPMALSKYCAYLVAFAPRLLPDHYVRTDYLFNSAVIGAEHLLKGCKSMKEKYTKIMNFAATEQSFPTNVTTKGGRVAKLLMEEVGDDVERLSKILADFWTEMVLFVAPCDDPWPHAEHLAQGGEFVTHLMALLFHAGVTKRDFIEDGVPV